MDSSLYQQLALRTESPGTPAPIGTLPWNAALLGLGLARNGGARLDVVKKVIFYGRIHALFAESRKEEPPLDAVKLRLLHGLLGKASELSELIDAVLPYLQGEVAELDITNVAEEIGDSRWYDAIMADAIGTTLGAIDRVNIDKLRVRYPERFSACLAAFRDLPRERTTLEGLAVDVDDVNDLVDEDDRRDCEG